MLIPRGGNEVMGILIHVFKVTARNESYWDLNPGGQAPEPMLLITRALQCHPYILQSVQCLGLSRGRER